MRVISVLGVKQIEGDAVNLMSDAMKIFVEAMQKNGVKKGFWRWWQGGAAIRCQHAVN